MPGAFPAGFHIHVFPPAAGAFISTRRCSGDSSGRAEAPLGAGVVVSAAKGGAQQVQCHDGSSCSSSSIQGNQENTSTLLCWSCLGYKSVFSPLAWGGKKGFPDFSSLLPFLGPACFNCPHSTPAFGNSAQQTLTPFPPRPLHPPDNSASRRHWEGRAEPGCIPTFPIPGMCPVTHTVLLSTTLLSTTLAPITRAGKGHPALGF